MQTLTACFTACYAAALVLEIARVLLHRGEKNQVAMGIVGLGLAAHTAYLAVEAISRLPAAPLSSWYYWCLLAAWVLAAAFLGVSARRSRSAMGLFMLPLVLVLIGLAYVFRNEPPFPTGQARGIWFLIHGITLLLGTVGAMIGLAAAAMYLVQSYRLKHKLPPRQGFQLPSLEWLGRFNSRSLIVSMLLLEVGLVSGVVMNLIIHHSQAIPWSDPIVWSSGLLLAWLIVAMLFESCYKPAREGRKVAYLTLASVVILGLVLWIALFGDSQHGSEVRYPSLARPLVACFSPTPNPPTPFIKDPNDEATDGRL